MSTRRLAEPWRPTRPRSSGHDWGGLRGVLADDATVTLRPHRRTARRATASSPSTATTPVPGALRRDEDLVDGGDRGVLRAHTTVGERDLPRRHRSRLARPVRPAHRPGRGLDRGRRTTPTERRHHGAVHHAIDYVEFNVADLARARAFYEQAFGWRFNDYGPEYAGIVATATARSAGSTAAGPTGPGGVAGAALLRRPRRQPRGGRGGRGRGRRGSVRASPAAAGSTSPTRPATSSASEPSDCDLT